MCNIFFIDAKVIGIFWVSTYESFLSLLLWFEAAPSSSGGFQEVEGESKERRRARLERHQRAQERVVCISIFSYLT